MKIKIWKVSQINSYIRDVIENDILLHSFFAEGEISNLKTHISGHIYFTLKDEKASISCVMFKTYTESVNIELKNGMKIIVCGYVSIFEKTGQIQLYVELIEPIGKGKLYEDLERLKTKLRAEGLFDEQHKMEIPSYPKTVGVITSKTGAAIQDIINVIKRRNGNIKIVIFPVLVQGESAPAEIVSAIKNMDIWGKADVIILGRGGGSAEDLWAFNDEFVAKAIYDCKTPIISAVGHETDFTISDLVADMRAPTPSAAAEIAVPELYLMKEYCLELKEDIIQGLKDNMNFAKERLNSLMHRAESQNPIQMVNIKRKNLTSLYKIIQKEIDNKLLISKNKFKIQLKSLENISPLKVLSRGYSLVMDNEERIITDAKTINVNDNIKIKFRDGNIIAVVNEKRIEN